MLESLIPVLVIVLVVGVVLGVLPMEPRIKTLAVVLTVVVVCLWLLRAFGLWG